MKILLVDDERRKVEVLEAYLEREGYEISESCSSPFLPVNNLDIFSDKLSLVKFCLVPLRIATFHSKNLDIVRTLFINVTYCSSVSK